MENFRITTDDTINLNQWLAEPSKALQIQEMPDVDPISQRIRFSLVIPTYNESANIANLIGKLSFSLDRVLPGAYELIVVDDDSPDCTWKIAQSLTTKYPQLRVIRRTMERGLSSAVIRGWQVASGKILGVIDGDLQHPPTVLSQMLTALEEGADLVVASRYATGGGVSNWDILRRFLSRGAQLLGLILLPGVLNRVSDPMSGYFIVRRAVIANKILNPIGYKILLEVIAKGEVRQVSEVGYVFQERLEGETKVTSRHYVDYLRHLLRLRFNFSTHGEKHFPQPMSLSQNKQIANQLEEKLPPIWLKVLVISLISLGIFFRFAHLEKKVYCCDESWTSFAISGHTVAEVKQEISDYQGTIPINTFNKYQHINPERGVGDTVNYLITSDPQHPPFYYVMLRLWAQVFGDSPTGVRSLSAIISLLIFPSVYWLCLELFKSPIVGWVAMGLIAVSPLQIFFAQEARQYSLWMVAILLSSAALLRALRQENKLNWAIYSLTLVVGLYTHLFTALVMITHGIYVFVQQQFRFTKTLVNYLIGTIAACLMFLPWLIVLVTHISTTIELTSGWTLKMLDNPLELIAIFLIRVSRTFFDFNLTSDTFWINSLAIEGPSYYSIPTFIFSLTLIIYLGYHIIKLPNKKTSLFLVLLGGIPALLLMMYDLSFGGVRSLQIRYQLPLYLSIEILAASVITFHIFQQHTWWQKIGQFLILGLLIAGLSSDWIFLYSQNWWTQLNSKFIIQTGQIINQSEKPLLVINNSAINLGGALTLSHNLSKVRLLSISDDNRVSIPQDYSHILFLRKQSILFQQLEQDQNYSLKAIKTLKPSGDLWQFEKLK